MTRAERDLHRLLQNGVNALDNADDPQEQASIARGKGNPPFKAQFDVSFLIQYFTVAAGAFTSIAAAALNAALKNQLAAFVFGNSDFAAGFARLQQQFPLSGGWTYGNPFVYGKDVAATAFGNADATGVAGLRKGDLVLPITATVGGTNYVAFVVLRCTQVAYATLLDSLNSDLFRINMIRYIINTTAYQGQYDNNINLLRQSLFGKFSSDFVSPNSFKDPDQQQTGVIDIPLKYNVDKNASLAMQVNYDAVSFQWSIFVETVNKLEY